MAETATIKEINGSPGTKTSLAGKVARFCFADAVEPGLTYPCKIPSSGFNYAWAKTHFLSITGDFNQVRDIYVYGDGNFAVDWGLDTGMVRIGKRDSGDNGLPLASYAQATGTPGESGPGIDHPVNGHPYYKNQNIPCINFDLCTAQSPLLIDSGPYTDDFESNAWVLDVKIPPTAVYGAKSPKSITVVYNIF
ncbi:MAG: hypothetical protein A4E48_00289 [Methanosaeta sp. PtaU1.Bin060]|nr:MAG: hypothetical protein A4E48_00289 [Methanosaeta sp. PtaU1.Bin060]